MGGAPIETLSVSAPKDRALVEFTAAMSIVRAVRGTSGIVAGVLPLPMIRSVRWVDPCGFPVDAKVIHRKPNGPKEARTGFFVRVANGTKSLDAVQREKYILSRWGSVTAGH